VVRNRGGAPEADPGSGGVPRSPEGAAWPGLAPKSARGPRVGRPRCCAPRRELAAIKELFDAVVVGGGYAAEVQSAPNAVWAPLGHHPCRDGRSRPRRRRRAWRVRGGGARGVGAVARGARRTSDGLCGYQRGGAERGLPRLGRALARAGGRRPAASRTRAGSSTAARGSTRPSSRRSTSASTAS
jgi:hypothetical protein